MLNDYSDALAYSNQWIDIIKQDRFPEEQQAKWIIDESKRNFAEHFNRGWLEYRKSVTEAGQWAAVEWTGRGAEFQDVLGRKYIDFLGGFGMMSHGWAHPDVVAAGQAQLLRTPMPSQELIDPLRGVLARLLAEITPGNLKYSWFAASGTEAVEAAIKIAKLYTGKAAFIVAVKAFHGKTMGSLSMIGKADFRERMGVLYGGPVYHVPFGDAEAVERQLTICDKAGIGVAGVMFEPIQGEAGAIVPPDDFWPCIRAATNKYGALLIADEVQTGLGRTGRLWGVDHWDVVPDILTIAKSLGGGVMPISAVCTTEEIFRPLNQVSVQVQPTKELTIAGQYYLEWESNIFPETGSYLGMVDGFLNSGEAFLLPTGPLFNGGAHRPSDVGDWGLKVSYSPEWLNGTLGFHYRNFSDKMPQVLADASGYHLDYKSNISLYGISFAKNILGVSVGSELSYRRNMPLTSQFLAPVGARGDTMHAVVNFLTLLPKTPVSDAGSAILEFAYGRWNRVSDNPQFFTGMNGYSGVDAATKDNSVVTVNLVPEWKQVLPGVDLAMPLNFSVGMHGNAATLTGGTEGTGSYSAGLSFDVFAKYKIDLTYASFFGKVHPNAQGQILPPGLAEPGQGAADAIALLRDRDLLSLTLKATF